MKIFIQYKYITISSVKSDVTIGSSTPVSYMTWKFWRVGHK